MERLFFLGIDATPSLRTGSVSRHHAGMTGNLDVAIIGAGAADERLRGRRAGAALGMEPV
jgi:hypothetical protein